MSAVIVNGGQLLIGCIPERARPGEAIWGRHEHTRQQSLVPPALTLDGVITLDAIVPLFQTGRLPFDAQWLVLREHLMAMDSGESDSPESMRSK